MFIYFAVKFKSGWKLFDIDTKTSKFKNCQVIPFYDCINRDEAYKQMELLT